LKAQIGELTEDKRNQLDQEMWIFKLKEMASIDFISHGRLQNNTIELIACIPCAIRNDILDSVKNHAELIKWFENKETTLEIDVNFDADVKKLLG
jgi:hypothetical protein